MTICVLKQCEVRHNAAVLQLKAGDFLTIPDGKEARLVAAGLARQATADDYHAMISDFGRRDQRGDCWDWIKKHQPELWRRHMQALLANDISASRLSYNEMLSAWSVLNEKPTTGHP